MENPDGSELGDRLRRPEKGLPGQEGRWDEWWGERFRWLTPFNAIWYRLLWRAYRRLIDRLSLGPDSRVIELGCGSGTISLKIAEEYGCKITLVDKSNSALELVRRSFSRRGISARLILADILNLPAELLELHDLAHSEGVVEHYTGDSQLAVVRSHVCSVVPDGHLVIFAPCRSLAYKISVVALKYTGNWYFGYEEPLTVEGLSRLIESAGGVVLDSTDVLFGREIGVLARRSTMRAEECQVGGHIEVSG